MGLGERGCVWCVHVFMCGCTGYVRAEGWNVGERGVYGVYVCLCVR